MKLYVSSIKNNKKPDSYTTKKISNTILENCVDISLEKFAEELTIEGKTVVLPELSKPELSIKTAIRRQQLIMLDFDNKGEDKYTIEDLESDVFMQNHALFYYRTFSDLESDIDKFRVVFMLDKAVITNEQVKTIYNNLFYLYPQADTSVGQTTRMFFGSNSGYELIDWDNRLLASELTQPDNLKPITIPNNELIDINTPIYKLLKYKKYELIQEKLGNTYSNSFPDDISASQYFKSLDMQEFLELPEGNPFEDIFHTEESPSASVFLADDIGIYLYKCFSQSSPFQGDIIKVLNFYLNTRSFSRTIDILVNVTNSEISRTTPLGEAKRDYDDLKKQLKHKQLGRNYPELYSYIKKYEQEIIEIMDIMFDFVYTDKVTGEVKYLNFLSVDRLRYLVGQNLKKNISRNKIWDILNLVIVTEMVTKLPQDDVPKQLLESVINKQKEESKQIRTSNFYMPSIELNNSYAIAKVLKDNNIPIRSLGFELVYRLFGEEKANQDFPQAYKPLQERNLIKMSDKDTNLLSDSVELEEFITNILYKKLSKNNYIFEEDIISMIAKKRKISLINARQLYTKVRQDVLNKYNLERTRLTKSIHKEFKIKTKYSPKIIILKNDM